MNYIYTLKDFACNKHCPYCITKILNRSEEEDVEKLPAYLETLEGDYEDFILSGNGEPSLYNEKVLSGIVNVVEKSGKFKNWRVQTSGLLFNQKKKLKIFDRWVKEITVCSSNQFIDKDFYQYTKSYLHLAEGREDVRCNYVMLKKNFHNKRYVTDLQILLQKYNYVAIKILDTTDDWVLKSGVPYEQSSCIIEDLTPFIGKPEYNRVRGRYEWFIDNKLISMSYGKFKGFDFIQIEG